MKFHFKHKRLEWGTVYPGVFSVLEYLWSYDEMDDWVLYKIEVPE